MQKTNLLWTRQNLHHYNKKNEFKRTLQLKLESDPVSFGKSSTIASLVEGLGFGVSTVTSEVLKAKAFTLGLNTFDSGSKFVDG